MGHILADDLPQRVANVVLGKNNTFQVAYWSIFVVGKQHPHRCHQNDRCHNRTEGKVPMSYRRSRRSARRRCGRRFARSMWLLCCAALSCRCCRSCARAAIRANIAPSGSCVPHSWQYISLSLLQTLFRLCVKKYIIISNRYNTIIKGSCQLLRISDTILSGVDAYEGTVRKQIFAAWLENCLLS